MALLNTSSGPCRREPCFVGWNAETRWPSFELDFVSSSRGRGRSARLAGSSLLGKVDCSAQRLTLSRWNLKVTNQAAGPGIGQVETRVSLEGHDGNRAALSSAMGVPWCCRLSRLERPRMDPDQGVRAAERGGREKESFAVRGSRSAGCFNKIQFCRQPTRNQREIGSRMAEKVVEGGWFRVQGSILVRRVGGVCLCRAEVSWVELESYETRRDGGCKETAVARVSQADKRMLFDGIQSSRVLLRWDGGEEEER